MDSGSVNYVYATKTAIENGATVKKTFEITPNTVVCFCTSDFATGSYPTTSFLINAINDTGVGTKFDIVNCGGNICFLYSTGL